MFPGVGGPAGSGRRGAAACCAQLEHRDQLDEILGLALHAAGGSGHFLDQCRILLRGLIHLRHGLSHLAHAVALLGTGCADLAHDVRDTPDGLHDVRHRLPGLVHQGRALFNAADAGGDEFLDLLGSLGGAAGQAAYLSSYDGKAAALVSSARCFHGGVQGQDIGLEGDAIDHADDVGNPLGAVVDALHGFHHLGHHLATFHGHIVGVPGELVGLLSAV